MAEYDVFISYRWVSPDQEWVRKDLFPALRAAGLRPLLDVEDFVPGRDLILEMTRAGRSSQRALCVVSPAYFEGNRMVAFEALNARRADPSGQDSKLIPLVLMPTELPEWMRGLVPVDWTDSLHYGREWNKLLRVLDAPNKGAPPPGGIDTPSPPPRNTEPPTAKWHLHMTLMKVNPRVVTPYAFSAVALLCASAAVLWIPEFWQRLPFVVSHAESTAVSKAMPALMKTLYSSFVGVAFLGAIITGLFNSQIVFSAAKMCFLLAFFSFLCALVTLISHESMIPHMVLVLLLAASFIKHFVLGSLGYYWKRRSLGDAAAEALLLTAFVGSILGPLRASF